MDMGLKDKLVCITGGSRGIGLAAAKAFAAEGATPILWARRPEALAEAAAEIERETGRRAETEALDVTSLDDIERGLAAIGERHGRLDVLVNNAGTGVYKSFLEITDEELVHAMAINFFAQFRITQRAVPLLRKGSSANVVNVSGRTALRGNFPPGSSASGPAKAAEVRFSTDLATELAGEGIRVNCVIPGVVKSEERLRLWEGQSGRDAERGDLEAQAGGWGTPAEVAETILFLASARASYVNGAALVVDGGPHTKSYVTQLYAAKKS